MNKQTQTIEAVKTYYGQILKTSADLKTSACCSTDQLPRHIRPIVKALHPDVVAKFYGCGSPIPSVLEGKTVLDLGCGAGRDSFILSKLVGEKGKVIGVDMTHEQLDVAKTHVDYHREKFGYVSTNATFLQGYIEDLQQIGISSNSVDVVVSNCVINLSPDKRRVFSEIFRALKPGGELYFSDVFSSRRVPAHLAQDPVLIGECLGGALYIEDFRRLLSQIGCQDYRVVTQSAISLKHPEIETKVGGITFSSLTIRAFKLSLEDRCEDYGQVAYYLGTLPQCPHAFPLDDHHLFEKGRPVPVCGNTAAMLTQTRYASHFRVEGDTSTHYGLFECAPKMTNTTDDQPTNAGCC